MLVYALGQSPAQVTTGSLVVVAVPVMLRLTGRAAWWSPRWLPRALPKITFSHG